MEAEAIHWKEQHDMNAHQHQLSLHEKEMAHSESLRLLANGHGDELNKLVAEHHGDRAGAMEELVS